MIQSIHGEKSGINALAHNAVISTRGLSLFFDGSITVMSIEVKLEGSDGLPRIQIESIKTFNLHLVGIVKFKFNKGGGRKRIRFDIH